MKSAVKIDETAMQSWLDLAQSHCLYHLQNEADAQDISQSVIIELLLNFQTIQKPEAWIKGTSRNKCYEFMRKKTAYRRMLNRLEIEKKLDSEIEMDNLTSVEKKSLKQIIDSMSPDRLMEKHKIFFYEYIECNCDLKYLEKKLHISKQTIRKRVSTIRSEITAWINQQRGMIAGKKKIAGEHLNKNIINFADKFQWCCQHNDWQPLKRYLAEGVEVPKDFEMPTYEKRHYEIIYLSENSYKIVLLYFGDDNKSAVYNFKVKIKPPYRIEIIKFPEPVKKVYVISSKKLPQNIRDKFKESPNGYINCSGDEIYQILSRYKESLEIINNKSEKDKKE